MTELESHQLVVDWLFWCQIPDHNVPTLDMMFDLVEDVKKWLSQGEGRVVALHCKVLRECVFFLHIS